MNGIRQELLEYVSEWARITEERLQDRVKSWKAIDSEDLLNSIRTDVYERSAGVLGVDVSFLTYGRFVDMGVGRGHGRGAARVTQAAYRERHEASPDKKRRRAKKWYSRTVYGRLNALNDVVMASIVDESINTIMMGIKANNFNYNT